MSYVVEKLNALPQPQCVVYHFCWFEILFVFGLGWIFWQLIKRKMKSVVLYALLFCNLLFIHLNLFFYLHPYELHLFTYNGQRHLIYNNGLESINVPFAIDDQRFMIEKGKNRIIQPN
jgi:hypothetical protein